MTRVYFVRHAEPNYNNHDDYARELSAKGLDDRKLVTSFLEEKSIDVVFSSPFKRAVETVKDFADIYGYDVKIKEEFRERKVDNFWIDNFHEFSKKQWEDFNYKLSDGESLRQVQERNIAALKEVVREYQDKGIVIGSHGTALSTVIHYFMPEFSFLQFEMIRTWMPWIVYFAFAGEVCKEITSYNLFSGKEMKWQIGRGEEE